MNRRHSYRSRVSRSTEQLFWIVVLLLLFLVLVATGWGASIIAWAGDLILDQSKKAWNTQPQ